MNLVIRPKAWPPAVVAAALFALPAAGQEQPSQVIINGQTAAENAESAGARSPGRMVSRGVARATERLDVFTARPEITDVPTPSIPAQVLPDAIDTIFEELNTFLFFIFNQILQREGLPALDPIDLIPDVPDDGTDNGTGNGDSTTDTRGGGRNPRGG